MLILAHCCWSTSTSARFICLFGECDRTNFNQTCYNVCSCEILICAYQRMKKLFELIRIFLSAMETWLMHGRWITMVVLLACVSPFWGLSGFFLECRKKAILTLPFATIWLPLRFLQTLKPNILIFFIPSSLIYFHFFPFNGKSP